MSLEAMAIALHHTQAKTATARLVMLGICNHDGDGGAWPAVATLAKYAGVHPRNVQRAISHLVEIGEIRVYVQQGGQRETPDFERPNLYEVLLACPAHCDRSRHHRDLRKGRPLPAFTPPVDNPMPDRVALASPGGAGVTGGGGAGVTQTRPTKPLENTHREPATDARARGACGHLLTEAGSRYCVYGCHPSSVGGAA